MDPEKLMNGISKEIMATLKAMDKTKSAEERLVHSESVKNLCESLGVFLRLLSDVAPYVDEEEDGAPF